MEKINRRNAMGILARWSAGSFIPFSWILKGCTYGSSISLFNKEYQSLLGAIVESCIQRDQASTVRVDEQIDVDCDHVFVDRFTPQEYCSYEQYS